MSKQDIIKQLYQMTKDGQYWENFFIDASAYLQDDDFLKELNWHLDNANDWVDKEQNLSNKQKAFESIIGHLPFACFYDNHGDITPLNQSAQKCLFLSDDLQQLSTSNLTYQHIKKSKQHYFLFKIEHNLLIVANSEEKITNSPLFAEWQLSKTEKNICIHLLQGLSISKISEKQFRSIHTVRNQVKTILRKSNCATQQILISKIYKIPFFNNLEENDIALQKTQTLTLKDGRTLAWCESGNLSGKPLILCHSLFQSRYSNHPDTSIIKSLNIRLICPDRPEYGRSSMDKNYTIQSWIDDLGQLLEHLKLESVAIVGVGYGATFALAAAEALPNTINKVVVGVYSLPFFANNINTFDAGILVKTGFKLCKNYPKLLRKILKLSMSKVILGDSMNFSRRLYPFAYNKNLQTMEDENLTQTMIANINESNAQGFGKATTNELHMLLNQNIYFNPQNIKQPVVFYTSNGKSINKIVKQSIPNAQVRTEKNNSIFVVYHRWKDIVTCAIENTK